MRKKEQLKALQQRIVHLKVASQALRESVEDCATASALVVMSCPPFGEMDQSLSALHPRTAQPVTPPAAVSLSNSLSSVLDYVSSRSTTLPDDDLEDLTRDYGSRKRKRLVSVGEMDLNSEDHELAYGNASAAKNKSLNEALAKLAADMNRPGVNWKNGTYRDPATGQQTPLSADDLERLRKERNRMHAKMTRDRKKMFVASIGEAISRLEADNNAMREALGKHEEACKYAQEQEALFMRMNGLEHGPGSFSDDDDDDDDDSLSDGEFAPAPAAASSPASLSKITPTHSLSSSPLPFALVAAGAFARGERRVVG